MCGPETPSSTPRVGARVDFFSHTSSSCSSSDSNSRPIGNLLFLNPSSPSSSLATHVRFQQPPRADKLNSSKSLSTDSILVSIHLTGDLTKPVSDSGLLRQFTLCRGCEAVNGDGDGSLFEMPLREALSMNVGQDGIIGRRVSMTRGGELLADGIVGFNFLPPAAATTSL
ncbi:hypothetical protein N656DRAFT_843380 [Canariomyces notabilis]|uniref:Uncharacterized protein n=1 Tax=Canariomyces notabilis TaxID=2074819 RepID=A0AAN6THS0_9PEZI|nr:hypothetical protein N656DRAFT_843380 [Canariomyces arenarius]